MPDNRFIYKLISVIGKLGKYKTTVMSMAVVVVFITTYLLILPALTLEKTEAEQQGGIDIPVTEFATDSSESDSVDADIEYEADTDIESQNTNSENEHVDGDMVDPLLFEGENYTVSVVDEHGVLPEGTSIDVEEINEQEQSEDYEKYYDYALTAIQNEKGGECVKDIVFARFYDITLISDEQIIEPAEGDKVNVKIEYDKEARKEFGVEDSKKVRIVHFTEDVETEEVKAEVLDTDENSVLVETDNKDLLQSTEFETDSFSVYAVVYTVDFHWEVDGKKFDFSIPGGGFISFSQLIEVLGIEKEDTKSFIENVDSITFSNPELLSVSKVEEDTTVGEIKNTLGLDCEYNKELTATQIAEINLQSILAVDWALISLKPFDSEETLTITMSNGEVFAIQVTDSQTGTIEDGGKYVIFFPYGDGYYYVLKGDGSTERINVGYNPNQALNNLSDEYLWTFDRTEYMGNTYWMVHSNSGLYLQLDETRRSQGTVTSYNPTGIVFTPGGDDSFPFFFVSEYSSNNNWGYEWYYLGFDFNNENVIVQNYWENTDDIACLFKQEERTYSFIVKTEYDNIYRGTVGGRDMNNVQHNNVASYVGITNNGAAGFTNRNQISATAYTGYLFDHWRLGDIDLTDEDFLIAPQISSDGKTSTIPAGALAFSSDNMVLTAVFKKDDTSDGIPDYSNLINEYMESLKKDPLVVDKTAEVYDYDNRIYEVDIVASGDAQIITPDVELAFVTDISRSMYFPSDLTETGINFTDGNPNANNGLIRKLDDLHNSNYAANHSSDGNEVYYVVANPTTDATVYAFRKNGNDWYAIDASYDVRDHAKKGVTVINDWDYRATSNPGTNRWFKVTDRYINNNGWKFDGKVLSDTNIYIAGDDIYRLDYLQQAVDIASDTLYSQDQDARIGLVTFAKTAEASSLYGKDQYHNLIYDLNDISPTGNTNQRAGLEEAANSYWQGGADPDHKRVVILITDGAPNPGSGQPNSDWSTINDPNNGIATLLKQNYNATLYTIGISVDEVEGARAGLTNAASPIPDGVTGIGTDGKYAFFTSDGPGLVNAILQIVQSMFTQVDLYGTVTDTVDSAFYPVNGDGTPVQQGFYEEDGTPLDPSLTAQYDIAKTPYYSWMRNGENWIITWYNVKFDRAEKDSDGRIVEPGVRKTILIKAKEDFLGGNTISTNMSQAFAIANYFREIVDPGETTDIEGPLTPAVNRGMDTPYVNVDELEMNDHENSWTVYLGTNVDPMTQLKEMYNDIWIREVVTLSKSEAHQQGIVNANSQVMVYDPDNPEDPTKSGTTIYEVERGAYEDDNNNLKDVIPASFKLSEVIKALQGYDLTNSQWNSLISGNELTFNYYGDPAYGHGTVNDPVGTIKLKLEQDNASSEPGLPDAHNTVVTNEENGDKPVEQYTLSVTYTPTSPKVVDYHTGTYVNEDEQPGVVTGSMTSINLHSINVFEKKLVIEKKDKDSGTLITEAPATFTLYKSTNESAPQKASDIVSNEGTVASGYTVVATMTTQTVGPNAGKTEAYSFVPQKYGMFSNDEDKVTTYYLVETQQPTGYAKSTSVWPVKLTISETPTNQEGATVVASELPYDWTQTAVLEAGEQISQDDSDTVTVTLTVENERRVDIQILKVDDNGAPLDLATFRLQKKEGSYQNIKSITVASDSEELKYPNVGGLDANSSFVSGTQKVTITNLPDGEYKLVEDRTHAGYIITQSEIEFSITNSIIDGDDIEGVVEFTEATGTTLALITVTNEPGVALPYTGGIGTTIFYVIGTMLILGCGIYLISRRRIRS